MTRRDIASHLGRCFPGIPPERVPEDLSCRHGKVREVFDLGDELLMVASDRVSAFDRNIGLIPFKGIVLNTLSLFWFSQTSDIVENHVVGMETPRAVRVRKAEPLPVEVVVRGFLTGSAWREYREGRAVSGVRLPDGMRQGDAFPEPIVTPSTKAEAGSHDIPISGADVVRNGMVREEVWNQVEQIARALYRRGREYARNRGLVLIDSKYEFGFVDDQVVLIDELHTPDSSRYWPASGYERFRRHGDVEKSAEGAGDGSSGASARGRRFSHEGRFPRHFDKEFLRGWLMAQGYQGEGKAPEVPREIVCELAARYIVLHQQLIEHPFEQEQPDPEREEDRIIARVRQLSQYS